MIEELDWAIAVFDDDPHGIEAHLDSVLDRPWYIRLRDAIMEAIK